jgi:hypothetical protein
MKLLKVATGMPIGTFKHGDNHPIHGDKRKFYKYSNGTELWYKKETFERYLEKQRINARKYHKLLKEINYEKYINNKNKYRNRYKATIAARLWRQKNKEKHNANMREYYRKRKQEPEYRIRLNLRSRLKDALKRSFTGKPSLSLIGCSIDFLKKHLESKWTEGMSWENYGKWHIDHIIPCNIFNLTIPIQQEECFNWKNLQPLWAIDNLKKGTKTCVI